MESDIELPPLPEENKLKPGDKGYNAFEDEDSPFYGLSNWKPRASRPVPTVRCHRILKNGERCKNRAIRGSGLETVSEINPETGELETRPIKAFCRMHGGTAPGRLKKANEIVQAARLALADSVPEAIYKLYAMLDDENVSETVQLKAATEILDRAGVKSGADMTIDVNVNQVSASEKLQEKLSSLRKPEELEDLGEVVEQE